MPPSRIKIKIILMLSFFIFGPLYSSPCLAAQRLSVVTSLFPLQEFAVAVGGKRVKVDLLLPPGAEPHTWEPKPSDLVKLTKANVFLYLGAGMEPWVHDLIKGINRPSLQIIEVSQGLLLLNSKISEENGKCEMSDHQVKNHKADKVKNQLHSHCHIDPHIWLDFHYDQIIVDKIANLFIKQDPEGTNIYRQNAVRYQKKLAELDQKYHEGLKKCCHRKIFLAGHSAFGYLAKRYHLEQIPLYGISPDAEPTPKKLAALVDIAKKDHIKAIYFEALGSNRLARVLAKEIGSLVLALNPGPNLTKKQLKSGVTFLSLMEENLLNLREGLICE